MMDAGRNADPDSDTPLLDSVDDPVAPDSDPVETVKEEGEPFEGNNA